MATEEVSQPGVGVCLKPELEEFLASSKLVIAS